MNNLLKLDSEAKLSVYVANIARDEWLDKPDVLTSIIYALDYIIEDREDNPLKEQAELILSESYSLCQDRKLGGAIPKVAHAIQIINVLNNNVPPISNRCI